MILASGWWSAPLCCRPFHSPSVKPKEDGDNFLREPCKYQEGVGNGKGRGGWRGGGGVAGGYGSVDCAIKCFLTDKSKALTKGQRKTLGISNFCIML